MNGQEPVPDLAAALRASLDAAISGPAQRLSEVELLNPSMDDALATVGCLLHWVASDPERLALFAADMEHCPGDLPPALVAEVLDATHRVLEPGCRFPAATPLPFIRWSDES